jgi:PQQ-like domain
VRAAASICGVLAACAVALVGCGGSSGNTPTFAPGSTVADQAASATVTRAGHAARVPEADWLRFDYDAQRSGVGPAATGITARNLHSLRLRAVKLPGTVDASAIELHGVTVRGRRRDVIVMTTTYGRTLALDPGTGQLLWEFRPADIGSYQGSSQFTTATPIADPDRAFVYAASPDGRIHKLALATGHEVHSGGWPTSVTFDPTHEKIAAALNISGNSVVVTTGGYIGDIPPYQGHVVMIDRSSGRITAVWNSLCSNIHSLIDPPKSCPATRRSTARPTGATACSSSARMASSCCTTGRRPIRHS